MSEREESAQEHFALRIDVGLVVGSVRDDAGLLVDDARIRLAGTDHAVAETPAGRFVFQNVTPGAYDLRVDADGFKSASERITVNSAVVARVSITLVPTTPAASTTAHASGKAVPSPGVVEVPFAWLLGLTALTAIASALAFVAIRRRPVRLVRLGREALAKGLARSGEAYARRALARDVRHADAWFLLGASLIHRREYAKAVAALESATRTLDPQIAGLAFLMTLALQRQGRPEAARRWLPLVARDEGYWDALENDPDTAFRNWVGGRPVVRRVDPAYA